jgi:hypothetical protein
MDRRRDGTTVSNDEAPAVVADALQAGYRHVDTAEAYQNETGVGEAVHDRGVLKPSADGNQEQGAHRRDVPRRSPGRSTGVLVASRRSAVCTSAGLSAIDPARGSPLYRMRRARSHRATQRHNPPAPGRYRDLRTSPLVPAVLCDARVGGRWVPGLVGETIRARRSER